MEYHFRVHEESDGLWAECIELSGCVTQGDSRADLEQNARKALSVYLDEPAGSGVDIPLPQENVRGDTTFAVELTPEIAFGLVLRHYRMAHKLSQNDMAKKLGMQHIYSYQRLERRPNPTLGIIKKIKDAIPDFPLERVLS
jgi:predicted RNase H-like HicB family nuclease